ncbi:MAG TPA: cytochrome d ubiquinol oxidase subunit II [Dissulfurispiraceae bacterium]|nr:cytochrome d ubiquinol oxidase subunit II [Dissulfurispiraceae bacterium]
MSMLENLCALLVLIGMIMYAAFAGADFGGGLWTALASGPRAHKQREGLFHAIGPVWETNHVWLIFVVVVLFSCFPRGFEVLCIAMLVPLVFALVGINFRGAAFIFRHSGKYKRAELPVIEAIFSISSILTPFFLGMAVSYTGAGHIRIVNGQVQGGLWSAWVTPFTVVGGLIGLAICAYITPFYMTMRTDGGLREDFRKHALTGAVVLGILTSMEIPIAMLNAPLFFERLVRPFTLLFVGLAVICGINTLILLWRKVYRMAQLLADVTIASTITGFAAALYPDMFLGQLTYAGAAAPASTLIAVMITLPIGAALLVPSLYFLYKTFGGNPNPELPLTKCDRDTKCDRA